MYINRFKVTNYKSFRESSPVDFTPGINVVVGQNSAGKTAIIEALSMLPLRNRHRSPSTSIFEGGPVPQVSTAEFSFSLGQEELREIIIAYAQPLLLPFPTQAYARPGSVPFRDDSAPGRKHLVEWFLSQEDYEFQLTGTWGEATERWERSRTPSFGLYAPDAAFMQFSLKVDGGLQLGGIFGSPSGEIGEQLLPSLRSRIYMFRAERLNVGKCAIGSSPVLASNASNLASVLLILQHNATRFNEFNEAVRSVLPQVPRISVRPTDAAPQVVEVRVWPFFDSHPRREDLTVPLEDCGTGVGQVLAILYVVLNSRHPSVILIDEPQSFLHPGAARKLIGILKMHPEHQYVVATHSPSIISAADSKTVTVARLESGETILERLSIAGAEIQETLLAELGARLSDVFGSDSVLWVEGRTEEICYGMIFRDLMKRPLMGTQVLGVRRTGDFEGDLAERVVQIYNKLTSSGSLIPPALGFLFDSECRSEQTRRELITRSRGLLHFLPRRMYENYLLQPAAVAAVANSTEGFSTTEISAAQVETALGTALGNAEYYCDRVVPEAPEARVGGVHAKRVLREVFGTLSEQRVRYDEIEHGSAITEWLIRNAPDELNEIREVLAAVVRE
jgi:AAA domain, putative AbiEii toxin, Type IV TA system/AAA ATPase domain